MSESEGRGGAAVITGASRGLGFSCAQRFLAEGWRVVGLDVSPPPADLADHSRFEGYQADVADTEAVAAVFRRLAEAGVRPAVLVNAAGMYPATCFGSATIEDFRRIFDLNVWGTVNVSQAFVEIAVSPASIVNIASRDVYRPPLHQYLYAASKAAIVNLTTGAAQALLERGIRVNAVSPPNIATEALRAIYGEMPVDAVEVETISSVVWELAIGGNMGAVNGQVVRVPGLGEIDY
ncbi:SDR family oxidoreductase [Leucobacter weissii]|uniref:SDR family oxidoreductase n=1 Tax=Leucobacter weissii TaxID=1983706 RepID=A0A939S912_9MICO|nr:SDR family oxidoreductase [Leucobacter weissii]MBO1900447.1 SDR family oxidoreductase [Leucobacter weissii]